MQQTTIDLGAGVSAVAVFAGVADEAASPNTTFAVAQLAATVGTDRMRTWTVTTTPGKFYRHQPLSKLGCAVLVPGQYRDAYQLGFHQNKPAHLTLVQTGGKVRPYRDNDRDYYAAEPKVVEEGHFGINLHRTHVAGATPRIASWSAGCHHELRRTCGHYQANFQNCYTHPLLRELN